MESPMESRGKRRFRQVVLKQQALLRMRVQGPRSCRRASTCVMPLATGCSGHLALEDLRPSRSPESFVARSRSRSEADTGEGPEAAAGFWPAAAVSVLLGVLSVAPYNMVLASDPGSPLFISFVTHLFFVGINAQQAGVLLRGQRAIPMGYHAGFVALGFLFNLLKSDAFARLPTSLCMLLMNLQMLVGMVVQAVLLGKRYSMQQLSGCAAVTAGVGWAASARGQAAAGPSSMPWGQLLLGVSEMFGALLALTLLSLLVKEAFSRHGESVEEQLFMQHLFGLPLFLLGGQWRQIGPRAVAWATGGDWRTVLLLVANMALTFGDRKLAVQVAGRAPNVLIVQLVETLKKFLSMLLSALLAAPPWPAVSFWLGALLLVLGTVQYLTASDAPEPERED